MVGMHLWPNLRKLKRFAGSKQLGENSNIGFHSAETRLKLSLMRRGSKNPFYGKKHTPETRAKLSAILRTYDILPCTLNEIGQIELAYMAGLLDGEGCICRHREQWEVKISNTHEQLIYKLQAIAGGSVNFPKKFGTNPRKVCGSWYIASARNVYKFLRIVRPFLIVKADTADICMVALYAKYGERLNG